MSKFIREYWENLFKIFFEPRPFKWNSITDCLQRWPNWINVALLKTAAGRQTLNYIHTFAQASAIPQLFRAKQCVCWLSNLPRQQPPSIFSQNAMRMFEIGKRKQRNLLQTKKRETKTSSKRNEATHRIQWTCPIARNYRRTDAATCVYSQQRCSSLNSLCSLLRQPLHLPIEWIH